MRYGWQRRFARANPSQHEAARGVGSRLNPKPYPKAVASVPAARQ